MELETGNGIGNKKWSSTISRCIKLICELVLIVTLQETTLGILMTLAYDVLRGGFIQIVHDGFGHWLTISTIEAASPTEVFVYDSMYASINTNVKRQIAAIMARPEEKMTVKIMDVQKQAGGSDCGLFAIAFATALVNGNQLGSYNYINLQTVVQLLALHVMA